MDNEMDKEPDKPVVEHEEIPADQGIKLEKHDTDEHGHGHGGGEEDAIVLHQEKLLPTILMAAGLVVLTLFGLAQAGNTKLDISTGKTAFDKVQSMMPKIKEPDKKINVPMTMPKVEYKTENNSKETKTDTK